MAQVSDTPAWLAGLKRMVAKLGRWPSLAVLTVSAMLIAVAMSQIIISVLGHGDRLVAGVCASACALALGGVFGYMFLSLLSHQDAAHRMLARHATLDLLTGLFNRRHFMNLVEREWSLARRYATDCALVLIDVDRFKRVNDCFGHECGDVLLQRIAAASSETLRQPDVLARFSGEEFILFLPHTDPLGALDVAERIRERVLALDHSWNGQPVSVSVTLGVAALNRDHTGLAHLIQDAEAALAVAKLAGRNCVRAAEGSLGGRARVLKS
jgi:diguanylate cyclase (GGDEF)-like protein